MQKITRSVGKWDVNIELAICDDHLPYTWGRHCREGGELDAGGGGSVKQNA